MQARSDKSLADAVHHKKNRKTRAMPLWRTRSKRRAFFAMARGVIQGFRRRDKAANALAAHKLAMDAGAARGYDPELLYVECGRCGAPVIWEEGRATRLLEQAGIDPLELDSSCMLMTDACPACGVKEEYAVRIFRVAARPGSALPPTHGHA